MNTNTTKQLNDGWKLKGFDLGSFQAAQTVQPEYDDSDWIPADVPGDVHSALLRQGMIKDPYYSTQDNECRWIERKVWWYRKRFDYEPSTAGGRQQLRFEGLDTLAEVFLNGESIGFSDNMFVPAVYDVTGKLKAGSNMLAVRFDSVVKYAESKDVSKFWAKVNYERIWVRKCASNYSWDWAPRMITVGIWKDVLLEQVEIARLDTVFFKTISANEKSAEIEIEVEVEASSRQMDRLLEATARIGDTDTALDIRIPLADGRGSARVTVENPKLWWTYDHGNPHLYDLEVVLTAGGEQVDFVRKQVGIRTIEVKQRDGEGNSRFTFVLNGKEIYVKGANWVPADCLIAGIEAQRYIELIELARGAHMNMLRVWGGGIYESPAFYNECSRQGLLVWQDFMFCCSELPDYDQAFMANVRREIEYNVKALRNHPCIAIWVGNNENQAIHSEKMYDRSDYRFYGEKIFHDLMPEMLERLDPTRLYWPSSPWGGNDPNSFDEGDSHNWAVWHGDVYPRRYGEKGAQDLSPSGISYRKYAEDTTKFASEFGIHGSAGKETLRRNVPESELYYGSFEMDYRNKDYEPEKGVMMLEYYTGLPKDLDEYIDYSMLCQAEGVKFGVEHYRRRKPVNSGALIWQLNDCWPGTSWSMIDYYLYPKAIYYYARRFFAPILLSFKEDGNDLSIWMTNDRYEQFDDTVVVGVMDGFGNTTYEENIKLTVLPNSSRQIARFSHREIESKLGIINRRTHVMYARSSRPDVNVNHYFFDEYKNLRFAPCSLEVAARVQEEGVRLEVETDRFARFIKLECPAEHTTYSDNYFNLLPGEKKTVFVSNPGCALSAGDIRVQALNSRKGGVADV